MSRSPASILAGLDRAPTTAADALVGLDTLAARLALDPRGSFARVYARVTRRVTEAVAAGRFEDGAWVSALSGRFAALYLDALAADEAGVGPIRGAWRVAFAAGRAGRPPLQDAVLGINAHVNADLALATAAGLDGARPGPTWERRRRDFVAVDRVLGEAIGEVLDVLAAARGCPVARFCAGGRVRRMVAGRAALAMVTSWRREVWGFAVALAGAGDPAARARVLAALDQRAVRLGTRLAAGGSLRGGGDPGRAPVAPLLRAPALRRLRGVGGV